MVVCIHRHIGRKREERASEREGLPRHEGQEACSRRSASENCCPGGGIVSCRGASCRTIRFRHQSPTARLPQGQNKLNMQRITLEHAVGIPHIHIYTYLQKL
jgi:hypothetical protein